MPWASPQHSRAQVDRAGDTLARRGTLPPNPISAILDAFDILSNWRSAHSFPLNTFQIGLRIRARNVHEHALVAQRLKRVPSIVAKLHRFPSMSLSRMQDIGGCRAVVESVPQVRRLRDAYVASSMRHKLVSERDYIANPKASGYRSHHLVYRYFSHRSPTYNGLLIEVQLRSRLQHAWATAVETVGTFLDQALKSSQGPEQWLHFFTLASSAFAMVEKTPPVPDTPLHHRELIRALKHEATQLRVFETLRAYGSALRFTETKVPPDARFFLLRLELDSRTLTLQAFRIDELLQATEQYLTIEKIQAETGGGQAVLVAADSLNALRRAYPNYFLDTQTFVEQLRRVLS